MVASEEASIHSWDSRTDDFDVILPLLKSYHGNLENDWLRYKFFDESEHVIATFAAIDDVPVAIAAAGLRVFTSGDGEVLGTTSLVTYVLPENRGGGLYSRLLAGLRGVAEGAGVAFMSALPNQMSLPSFKKAGYEHAGDSVELIHIPSFSSVLKAVRNMSGLGDFVSLGNSVPNHSDLLRLAELDHNESQDLVSALRGKFIFHRLSAKRDQCYTVDFVDGAGVISMHGFRGNLREVRILASAPYPMLRATRRAIYSFCREKYDADLITSRFTAKRPPPILASPREIARRANPPLFILTTSVAPPFFSADNIRLRGIDTHTW